MPSSIVVLKLDNFDRFSQEIHEHVLDVLESGTATDATFINLCENVAPLSRFPRHILQQQNSEGDHEWDYDKYIAIVLYWKDDYYVHIGPCLQY